MQACMPSPLFAKRRSNLRTGEHLDLNNVATEGEEFDFSPSEIGPFSQACD